MMIDIGIPVYNGEKTIAKVLDSILNQSYRNFRLIISDNSSNDRTEIIIKEYLRMDPRIEYHRQDINIGTEANFKYLFNISKNKYFLWAASDDIRSSNFLEDNINFLENNNDYAASTLQTRFEGGDFSDSKMGDFLINDSDPIVRVKKQFNFNWFNGFHANGRYYSLIRRDALADIIHKHWNYLGSDWMISAHLLSKGKINRINSGYVELGKYGASNSQDLFTVHRESIYDLLIPFHRLSYEVWNICNSANSYQKIPLFLSLMKLNLYGFLFQFYLFFKR